MDENMQKQTEILEKEISDERDKLSTDRMDISFGELINLYKNGELIIRPEYQRLFRWTLKQKTALIESILLSIPIPPIFVAEDEEGIWELVDGLQRVATFISFFGELNTDVSALPYQIDDEDDVEEDGEISIGNKWTLEAGGLIQSLEGFNIDTLPTKYKINLKRSVCRVEILRGESNTAMKYELFKRLNSGGSKATPQEIRNAVYRAVNPAINDLISELSQNQSFQKLTALTTQKKRELYDHELVLRFVAFLNNAEKINENTEGFLNSFMEESVKKEKFDTRYYKKIFNQVIAMIDDIGDEKVFRNKKNLFVTSDFEGITIGLAQNMKYYTENTELLKSKIRELKEDKEFRRVSGVASSSKNRIKARLKRANKIFSSVSNK
jgi:hypothetical protein